MSLNEVGPLSGDLTFLPCTMKQWEDLTNEMTIAINRIVDPHFLDAQYVAQVLMSAIHAYDHKVGVVSKTDLFHSCINRISCHVTYHAVNEIQRKIKEEAEKAMQAVPSINTEGLSLVAESEEAH